jgi:hypothetical protein
LGVKFETDEHKVLVGKLKFSLHNALGGLRSGDTGAFEITEDGILRLHPERVAGSVEVCAADVEPFYDAAS